MMFEGIPLAAPFIQTSKLRALAVTSTRRSPLLPQVPTSSEAGFPNLVTTAWYGIVAPAGTPDTVLARLNKAVNTVLADPGFKEKLAQKGMDAAGGAPADFSKLLGSELTMWADVVKSSGAKVE